MLDVTPQASRRLAVLLLAAHGLAIGCALSVALPSWLHVTLLIGLSLSLLFNLAHQAWRVLPYSVVSIQIEREGGALILLHNGQSLEAQVLGSSFVAPYLTIIRFKPLHAWFARSVVLLPDMLPPKLFRTLRVWLKWRLGRGESSTANVDWTGST